MTDEKLVRDRIPEIAAEDGSQLVTRVAKDDEEFIFFLHRKLLEEASEVIAEDTTSDPSRSDLVKELADLEEVVRDIRTRHGISTEEVETVRAKRLRERGGFEKRLIWKPAP